MVHVLFVCLGNICRSPAAEGILLKKIAAQNLGAQVVVDSCGTGGWHVGENPDERMIHHAGLRGYDLNDLEARQFNPLIDFDKFDLILTMDKANYTTIHNLDRNKQHGHKIQSLTHYCRVHDVSEVPDPYYKDTDGFELVLDILEDACDGLLADLTKKGYRV